MIAIQPIRVAPATLQRLAPEVDAARPMDVAHLGNPPFPPGDQLMNVLRHAGIGAVCGAAAGAIALTALAVALPVASGTMGSAVQVAQAAGFGFVFGGISGLVAGPSAAGVHGMLQGQQGYHPATAAIAGAVAGAAVPAGFVLLLVRALRHAFV